MHGHSIKTITCLITVLSTKFLYSLFEIECNLIFETHVSVINIFSTKNNDNDSKS